MNGSRMPESQELFEQFRRIAMVMVEARDAQDGGVSSTPRRTRSWRGTSQRGIHRSAPDLFSRAFLEDHPEPAAEPDQNIEAVGECNVCPLCSAPMPRLDSDEADQPLQLPRTPRWAPPPGHFDEEEDPERWDGLS